MKNIYLAVLLFTSLFTSAQVVFERSLSDAFKKAKAQNKNVFIEYYNSDCSVCKRLGTLLKEDAEIISYYNSNFINYAINTYNEVSDAEKAFLKTANLHFDSVPVLLYFDKDKNFLHYSSGEINAEAVLNEAKKAVLPQFNSSGLRAKYEAGDRSIRTLYAYSNLLIVNREDHKLKKVTQDLFESFDKSELSTKKSYLILKRVVKDSDNGFFKFWLDNLDQLNGFESGENAGTEKSYLSRIVLIELTDPNIKKWGQAKKEKYKNYILKLKIVDDPNVFF
ncbi:thioredoxin family protein [Flavobacterium ardleyense]|uniref:thioredoxin family protein n=1 Tax=Flavobacterium ardleyense TaxID=2038737 RepID=UPI00298C61FB|nr:thioredoxin family protein [Flavobacterium ardleyense]